MYVPRHFDQADPDQVRELVADTVVGDLVTVSSTGLTASLVPFVQVPGEPHGALHGHLARANNQWRETRPEQGALAVFQGPQAYVSPSFYPSKAEHGKVVPTWNYAVVHAHASVVIHEEPEWLRGLVTRLTESQEAAFANPWQVSDAPGDYIEGLLKAIVGIELRIHKLEGKWKASQNRNDADRAAVMAALGAPSEHRAKD